MKLERWAQAVERLTHAYDLMPEAKKICSGPSCGIALYKLLSRYLTVES